MSKDEVAVALEEIGTLLALKGENDFKVRAYQAAGRPLDQVLTLRTDEQGLFCQWQQINDPNFKIFYSSGGGYQVRIALTAGMMKLGGVSVGPRLTVPFRMRQVQAGQCNPKIPAGAPVSTVVPDNVLTAMFPSGS